MDAGRGRRCYVYGIVREADAAPLPAVRGVDGAAVAAVSGSGLAAVVTPLAGDDPRLGRADVLAHSDVVQALVDDRDVLPVRFGTVYPGPDQVRDDLLSANARSLSKSLDGLAGMVELQVKATYVEESLVAELVGADRRLQRLRATLRASPDYSTRVELGRRFATVLDARRESDARQISRALRKFAARVQSDRPASDFGVANLAFLVARSKLDSFRSGFDQLRSAVSARMHIRCVGPLAPYSFVGNGLSRTA